jgi:hypothetical protein
VTRTIQDVDAIYLAINISKIIVSLIMLFGIASIHDNTAIFLAGEASKSPSLKVSAYFSLAGRKSVFELVIVNKIDLSSNEFFGIFHFKHQYKIKITIEKIAKKILALLNNFQKHEKQNINNSYIILFTIRFIKIYINQLHLTLSAFKRSLKHTTTKYTQKILVSTITPIIRFQRSVTEKRKFCSKKFIQTVELIFLLN